MANVLVFAEVRGGDLRKVALEAVTAARALADVGRWEVHAVLAGGARHRRQGRRARAVRRRQRARARARRRSRNYNPEALAATIAQKLKGGAYGAALFSATSQGRDLSPRVAAKLGVGLGADLTDFALKAAPS